MLLRRMYRCPHLLGARVPTSVPPCFRRTYRDHRNRQMVQPPKGYGFILPDDGTNDDFVPISAWERSGLTTLHEGQKVECELVEDQRGSVSADNLKLI